MIGFGFYEYGAPPELRRKERTAIDFFWISEEREDLLIVLIAIEPVRYF